METSLRKERLRAFTSILASISGLFSIGHFIVLVQSVCLAKDYDVQFQQYYDYTPGLFINLNIPFAVFLALFGAAQMAASLLIFFFNKKRVNLNKVSLISAGGAAASFAVSFLVITTAINYNQTLAMYEKYSPYTPNLVQFYHWLYADALLSIIFSIPFLLFIFYRHLEVCLQSQQKSIHSRKQYWVFFLLINICAHLALIIRAYKFSQNQNPVDYSTDTFVSIYSYGLIVEMAICLIAFIILSFHFKLFRFIKTPLFKSCLAKSEAFTVAVAAVLFQLAAFVFILVKTSQIYIDFITAIYRNCFLFRDCDDEKSFGIFATLIMIISGASLMVVISGMKGILDINWEDDRQKDLLTVNHSQS